MCVFFVTRYFLKHQETALNIPEDMADDVAQEMDYVLLDIPHSEMAIRLTLRAIELFQAIDQSEHVVDLFRKEAGALVENLVKFSQVTPSFCLKILPINYD